MSNKKKQILNESTVRRFMGLAGIGALSNNFVNEKQIKETDGLEEQESGDMPYKGSENKGGYGKVHSLGKIDSDIPKAPTGLGKKPVASTPDLPKNLEEQEEFPPEEELPPMDDLGAEGEMPPPEEAPVEDVDISQEEAEVLISLGRKLEAEMGPEEELGGEEELGMPPEEMGPPPGEELPPEAAMAESLVRALTGRVANRIKKEYVVNEVMKRVARRIAPRKK